MAQILLFHHVLGLTDGVQAFGNALAVAGHDVIVPDLFDGATFDSIDAGVAHAESIGFETIAELGAAHADSCGSNLVVAGFSLGAVPAQKVAQTREGVAGAVLYHSAVPLEFFSPAPDAGWPSTVAVEIHLGDADPIALEDRAAADAIVASAARGELHLYPTDAHLVADVTAADYDADIARVIVERTLDFLERVDRA